MKISKIILFFISFLLSFLFLAKDTFAVTFNGSSNFQLQSVAFSPNFSDPNLSWKTIWSFDYKNRINDIVGINCINYVWKNCTNYIVQTTQIFRFDLKNIDYSNYKMGEIYLLGTESYVEAKSEVMFKADWIYEGERERKNRKTLDFYYELPNWDKKTIYQFDANQKCGSDNPHICVLALNSFFTYSAHPATSGVYWTYSDISLYNSAADKVFINRIHHKKSNLAEPGFFSWLPNFLEKFEKKVWVYGTRISDIKENNFIYLQKDKEKAISDTGYNRSYKGIKYIKDKETWDYYFSTLEDFTYNREITDWYYMHIPRINKYTDMHVLGQFDDFSYKNYRKLTPYFNKFLWGQFHKSVKDWALIYTLQDIFWFNSSFFQQQGDANSQDNSSDSIAENFCQWVDISCHVKSGVSSFFTWLKGLISDLFTSLPNLIWDFLKSLLNSVYSKFEWFLKPFWDYIVSFFKPLWSLFFDLSTWNFDWHKYLWWDQEYLCSKKSNFIIETTTWQWEKPMQSLMLFLYFINPLIISDNTNVCTNLWIQKLNYWKSTLVDVMIFNIFVAAGIWFPFIYLRKNT